MSEFECGMEVSIIDTFQQVVIARGTIKHLIHETGSTLCTLDDLYYVEIEKEGRRFSIERKNVDEEVETFATPFRFSEGMTYAQLSPIHHNAQVLLNLTPDNLCHILSDIQIALDKIFPKSTFTSPVFETGTFTATLSEDEKEDFVDLVTDKCNIFGRRFRAFESESGTYVVMPLQEREYVDNVATYILMANYLDALLACNYRQLPEDDLLYYNNYGRRSYQWEMWAMCNNLCSYCYLGTDNRHTDKVRQMQSLTDCHKAIDNLDTRIYNNISIIGGDFWQGQLDDPEVHDSFMALMEKCAKLYADKKIGSLWITCTMTIGDQHHLYEMLDIFERYKAFPDERYGSSGLWLCTSWDAEGRFHTPDRKANWEYHMKNIHKLYPWVKFNCTIILMEKFLQMYLDGEWSPKKFMEEFHTYLFFKQIGLGEIPQDIPEGKIVDDPKDKIGAYRAGKYYVNKTLGYTFAPHRETMLKFLRKYAIEDPDTYDRLFNIRYRADELHRNYNERDHDVKTTRNKNAANETDASIENVLNTCGHMINYAPYVDSDKCCICDKKAIWESIYGS